MAIQTYKPEADTAFSFKDRLPTDRYTCRVIGLKYEPSKGSGNPMVTVDCELCLPETVNVNGAQKEIAGKETSPLYFPLINLVDGERDDKASSVSMNRYLQFMSKLQLPTEVDDENPDLSYTGIVFDAICGAEESVRTKEATPEQKAKGQKGDEIKDENGKSIKSYRIKITEVLGRSSVVINRPY